MSDADLSAMDLGRLKVQLRGQLKMRQKRELQRHRKSVDEQTRAARRAIAAARTEAEAYDAIERYTRMLASLRGTPLREVRS